MRKQGKVTGKMSAGKMDASMFMTTKFALASRRTWRTIR